MFWFQHLASRFFFSFTKRPTEQEQAHAEQQQGGACLPPPSPADRVTSFEGIAASRIARTRVIRRIICTNPYIHPSSRAGEGAGKYDVFPSRSWAVVQPSANMHECKHRRTNVVFTKLVIQNTHSHTQNLGRPTRAAASASGCSAPLPTIERILYSICITNITPTKGRLGFRDGALFITGHIWCTAVSAPRITLYTHTHTRAPAHDVFPSLHNPF